MSYTRDEWKKKWIYKAMPGDMPPVEMIALHEHHVLFEMLLEVLERLPEKEKDWNPLVDDQQRVKIRNKKTGASRYEKFRGPGSIVAVHPDEEIVPHDSSNP